MTDAVLNADTNPFSVQQHFHGRSPAVREIYDAVVSASRQFGPVIEDPKKTSIHLNNRTAFAGVATRRDFMILTIKSKHDIMSPRIFKREQASANRWHLEVKLLKPDEVDSELTGWLREAYDLSV
ncbi:MAG TPA: DUF5655 domain-containing protein [Pyrinomonadaceae bacterium]|nr:DUF5655 domain-containing protein [Pyrinomonadaceae bacterium]